MEDKDLMEMRSQIALLRQKLEKEQIVSSRLLKETMKTKMNMINRQGTTEIACGVFCIIIYPFFHLVGGFSLAFVVATIVMMLVCIGFTWYYHRPINDELFSRDTATVVRIFTTLKRRYQQWIVFFTPAMIIPWFCWFCYEQLHAEYVLEEARPYVLIPSFVGLAIGLLIGFRMHRKVIRNCNEILAQLEE